jgi:integrase
MLPQFVVDTLRRHHVSQLEKRLAAGTAWVDRDLVFPDEDGDFLVPVTLLRRFRRLLGEVGLPRIRFHDLRHNAATLLLGMGVPAKWSRSFWGIVLLVSRWMCTLMYCPQCSRMLWRRWATF